LPDHDFARWLTEKHGVAVIPVSAFYAEPPRARLIRFCFAKESGTLERAIERLVEL
jgi:methionine aminotransferase